MWKMQEMRYVRNEKCKKMQEILWYEKSYLSQLIAVREKCKKSKKSEKCNNYCTCLKFTTHLWCANRSVIFSRELDRTFRTQIRNRNQIQSSVSAFLSECRPFSWLEVCCCCCWYKQFLSNSVRENNIRTYL